VPGVSERLPDAGELLVPIVAPGELEYGANLATPPESQRAAVSTFKEGATLLLPTAHAAAEYGRVKLALKTAGAPIPEDDLWIAAAASEHGLPLATRDAHFNQVLGLTAHDWR